MQLLGWQQHEKELAIIHWWTEMSAERRLATKNSSHESDFNDFYEILKIYDSRALAGQAQISLFLY